MKTTAPTQKIPRAIFLALNSSLQLQSCFFRYNFQNEKPNSKIAAPRRQGRKGSKKVKLLIKLADVPNMTNMAGPIQQDTAKNEVRIVPILDTFSVLISVHLCFQFQGPQEKGNIQYTLSPYVMSYLQRICAIGERKLWTTQSLYTKPVTARNPDMA